MSSFCDDSIVIPERTYAQVAVGLNLDQEFEYEIPAGHLSQVRTGVRVKVEFGRRIVTGYVTAVGSEAGFHGKHKPIREVLDTRPTFSLEMLDFLRWAALYYHVPVGVMLERSIPGEVRGAGLDGAGEKQVEVVVRTGLKLSPEHKMSPVREKLLLLLGQSERPWTELRKAAGARREHLDSLIESGLVELRQERTYREPEVGQVLAVGSLDLELTPGQQAAMNRISPSIRGPYEAFLLHGVTGSGKTEVYLRLAAEAMIQGRDALILVPEIALTPQLAATFKARFGDRVAVLHSALGPGQRYDQWCLIAEGKRSIVLGARSAIFAPLDSLGLIIVDEEHEPSFKQETSPFYNARDLALVRGRRVGATVVLGSATPSLESYANTRTDKLTYVGISERATPRPLPEVSLIDLRVRRMADENRIFSDILADQVRENLEQGGQTILFLNRRGYAPFLLCPDCGHVPGCEDCSVSLTYHEHPQPLLVCHYCDHMLIPSKSCPVCGSEEWSRIGFGLERAEESFRQLFPDHRLAVVDSSTGQRKLLSILDQFRRGDLDCLMGTQILAKGHDFPGVSLVGVLLADHTLGFPDFRGAERTFQLMTQVAGRAGRGPRSGQVMVQTFMPQHFALLCAQTHDFLGFAEEELRLRALRRWPPFSTLALLRFKSRDEELVRRSSIAAAEGLVPFIGNSGLEIHGPIPAPIARVRGWIRYQILLKAPSRGAMQSFLSRALEQVDTVCPSTVKWDLNVDPVDLM